MSQQKYKKIFILQKGVDRLKKEDLYLNHA